MRSLSVQEMLPNSSLNVLSITFAMHAGRGVHATWAKLDRMSMKSFTQFVQISHFRCIAASRPHGRLSAGRQSG
jgi:hypothetical protein